MSGLGKLLATLRLIRVYPDGSGYGFVWQWWNPLAWLVAPTCFLIICFMDGAPNAWRDRHQSGFGINPYFKQNGIDPFKDPTP